MQYGMSRFNAANPTVQLVQGPGQYELTGVTLGSHMLVGVRRWRVLIIRQSPPVLSVETEAYEQNSSYANAAGRWALGQSAQYAVWDNYLNNIGAAWVTKGATLTPARHIPEVDVGAVNPWRAQLPLTLQ